MQAKPFTQAAWLVHGFSTRPGGASRLESGHDGSQSVEKVLNLGLTDWDSRERVAGNRRKFLSALGASRMRLVTLRQAHSDMIHVISRAPENSPRGDAAITAVEGLLLSVQTADCVPILLADMHCRVVAAVHSGWRGTLKRIAAKTVGRMQLEFGTNPRDIVAALGPAIGRCSYEVGSEIAKEFASQFAEARDWFDGPFDRLASDDDPNPLPWLSMAPPGHQPPSPRLKLDLFAANRAILLESGVNPENIFACGLCTACRTDLFFSYRREHHTGRMMAVIGLP
ncbi:MAG: peptidoglycan editing factor PgeF [Candidatus Acidiferrales bacterium]